MGKARHGEGKGVCIRFLMLCSKVLYKGTFLISHSLHRNLEVGFSQVVWGRDSRGRGQSALPQVIEDLAGARASLPDGPLTC